MDRLSTREAAKKLGIDHSTLANYVAIGKVPPPETVTVGRRIVHMWTDDDIVHVRELLPKIANGRKTRYKKKNSGVRSQKSVKPKTKTKKKPQKKP